MRAISFILLFSILNSCNPYSQNQKYSVSEFINESKLHGIDLEPVECVSDDLIDGDPFCFRIDSNNINIMYVYELKSIKDVENAIKEYREKISRYNVVIPQIFELINVVILYYTNEPRTDFFKDRDMDILGVVNNLIKKKETVE